MSGPRTVSRLRSHGHIFDDVDDEPLEDLNIHFREHGEMEPPPPARKGRKDRVRFQESSATGLKNLAESVTSAVKHPLTGIRPGFLNRKEGLRRQEKSPTPIRAQNAVRVSAGEVTAVRPLSPVGARDPSENRGSRRQSVNSDYDPEVAAAPPRALRINIINPHGVMEIDPREVRYPHLFRLDDIDISELSRRMPSEEEVAVEDEIWTFDTLYATLTDEMRQEWEDAVEGDEEA